MPKIKRHKQKNDSFSAFVELQLVIGTSLVISKIHSTGEMMLSLLTAKFAPGAYDATSVAVRLALTKAEAQEVFAAIGYCLKSKPRTSRRAASPKPKRAAFVAAPPPPSYSKPKPRAPGRSAGRRRS